MKVPSFLFGEEPVVKRNVRSFIARFLAGDDVFGANAPLIDTMEVPDALIEISTHRNGSTASGHHFRMSLISNELVSRFERDRFTDDDVDRLCEAASRGGAWASLATNVGNMGLICVRLKRAQTALTMGAIASWSEWSAVGPRYVFSGRLPSVTVGRAGIVAMAYTRRRRGQILDLIDAPDDVVIDELKRTLAWLPEAPIPLT